MVLRDMVTVKEIAQTLGVTERGVQVRASRESWHFEEVACRGGKRRLYPLASLPADVRSAIAAAMLAGGPMPDALPNAVVVCLPAAQAASSSSSPLATLTKHQRETALARLAFVREIERLAAAVRKEKAIRHLVDAARDGSLPPRLAALVAVANDRMAAGRGLSRRRLYDWCAKFSAGGEAALAPRHVGKDMSVPDWAPAFLAIWQQPQKPAVTDAYNQFVDAWEGTPPSIFAVRRFLAKMADPDREAGRDTGKPWTPGQRVRLVSEPHGLDATYFLMARSFLGGRDKGSVTELTLKEDGVWLPELAKTGGKGKGKTASAGKVVDL